MEYENLFYNMERASRNALYGIRITNGWWVKDVKRMCTAMSKCVGDWGVEEVPLLLQKGSASHLGGASSKMSRKLPEEWTAAQKPIWLLHDL